MTLREVVQAEGLPARVASIRTVNVVATGDFGASLDLIRLVGEFPDASYEPEAFPGMILRNADRSAVLLFSSGKFVLSGFRSERSARMWIAEFRQKMVLAGHLRRTRARKSVR